MPSVMRNLTHSWLPKGSGEKGPGLFSNSNSHDAEPNYFASMHNLVVRNGAWAMTRGNTAYGSSGGMSTISMTLFNSYSGISQALTSKLIGFQYQFMQPRRVRNITDGVDVRTGLGAGRMVFANVKNRLYMANGTDGPAIMPTATTYYAWGTTGPVANLSYQIGSVFAGTATVSGGGVTLTWNSGQTFPAFSPTLNGQMPITINGVPGTVTAWNSSTSMTVSGAWGDGGPWTFTMGQTVLKGTANLVNGNPLATWVSGDPFTAATVGSPIYFSSVAAGAILVSANYKYVVGSLALPNLNIAPNWVPANLNGANWQVNTGPMTWLNTADTGSYQYSYYYYDPVSGHCSPESPVLEVADGEPDNNNVSVNITGIVTTGSTRFTRIILSRSSKSGTERYPLASLPNSGGPLSYIDTLSEDARLGTDTWVGTPQPGRLPSPDNNNLPPPSDLNHIVYWDGRFWGSSNTQVGLIFYSARNMSAQIEIPLGVAEECWPLENTLNIPGDDGRVTGFCVVGQSLFALTDKSIYQVVGASIGSYATYKITSRGGGTSHFAACEIPGADSNAGGDILAYFGNDARLHFLFVNGGDYPQSYAVQDILDTTFAMTGTSPPSMFCNLGLMHQADATYLVLQMFRNPGGQGFDRDTLLFDLDRKVWFRLLSGTYPSACFVEGLLGTVLTAFVGSYTDLEVYKFMDAASASLVGSRALATFEICPPGLQRKQYKDFQSLVVYTNEPAALDTVTVTTDSGTPVALARVDTADARIASIFGGDDASGMYAHQYVPQGTIIRGRVFSWSLVWNPTLVESKIQEVRALWTYEDATESAGNV